MSGLNQERTRGFVNGATAILQENFQHQYPTNPFIKAQYITGTKTFYFWYKNGFQYQIPDNYSVETEVSGIKIQCETKYQLNGKVRFMVAWKENRVEWSLYSDRSATSVISTFLKKNNRPNSNLSGIYIFGFDIGRLHEYRLEIIGAPIILANKVNKRKQPLSTIQSILGQNKRFTSL
ncbi:7355_t:CDS:2, partial [Funneliformis caledonium]